MEYPNYPQARAVQTKNRDGSKIAIAFGESDCSKFPLVERLFCDNHVISSQFTTLNFLPKSIFVQFQRAANFYFLVMSLVMLVGENTNFYPSPVSAYSTFSFLVLIMVITMMMMAKDDIERHREDNKVSNQKTQTIRGSIVWRDVRVGDVIVVQENEQIPADMILMTSSNKSGNAYAETSNIDGETNLKIRQPSMDLSAFLKQGGSQLSDVLKVASKLGGHLEYDVPNRDIAHFEGILSFSKDNTESLCREQVLLRGSILRNTQWCVGLVVYTGKDTKVAMNSIKSKPKLSNAERVVNRSMKLIMITMFVLVVVTNIGSLVMWHGNESSNQHWYLFPDGSMEEYDFPPWLANMFVFFILFNNMVPISMYIALDIVNLIHSKVIGRDESLQDESGIPAKVRSMNLCSELGQIEHLLTDKTGTLTRNEMKLKFCSIAGKIWGRIKSKQFMDPELRTEIKKTDDSVKAQTIMWFLRSIALSHTVMAVTKNKSGAENLCNGEEKENIEGLKNNIRYKAESPDEEALVEGASAMGFQFVGRTSKTISVRIPSVSLRSSNSSNQSLPAFGEDCESDDDDTSLETYKILAINRFNSTRKRMSVLLQPEKGNAVLLCKGADSTIFSRCKTKDQDIVSKHVDQFSRMGLRTLVVAMREISSDELKIWLKEYNEALHSTQDRDARLERAAETIERDMTVLGASAIEDMLQDKVASCITDIRKAGIKIWVLTGDKVETAISIARSSTLLHPNDKVYRVEIPKSLQGRQNKLKDAKRCVQEALSSVHKSISSECLENEGVALVLTGSALTYILNDKTMHRTLELISRRCSVVVACRVSPAQKALMVKLVKGSASPSPITLAIGDGANDVSMIKEAHVGVGISGHEGMQAANSADFSISKFRFLRSLLLIHGRTDYHRVSLVILFSFFKNITLVLTLFYYNFFNGFSGRGMYEDWMYVNFNAFTFFPCIVLGFLDKDVETETVLSNPQLYITSREQQNLNLLETAKCIMFSFLTSALVFLIPYTTYSYIDGSSSNSVWGFGTVTYTSLLTGVGIRAMFLTNTWGSLVVLGHVASILLFAAFLFIHGHYTSLNFSDPAPFFYRVGDHIVENMYYWVVALFECLGITLIHLMYEYWSVGVSKAVVARVKDDIFHHTHNKRAKSFMFNDRSTQAKIKNLDSKMNSYWKHLRNSAKKSVSVFVHTIQDITKTENSSTIQWFWSPRRIFNATMICFCAFLIMGIVFEVQSQDAVEIRIKYSGNADASDSTVRSYDLDATERCRNLTECDIPVYIPTDMKPPIWLQYRLTNFYQNYNSYFISRDSMQLRGLSDSSECLVDGSNSYGIGVSSSNNETLSPCGLFAQSLFNDSYEIIQRDNCTCDFVPSGFQCEEETCVHREPTLIRDDLGYDEDFYANHESYPNELNTLYLHDRFPEDVVSSELGVKSMGFVTWMRAAAFSEFKKPVAKMQVLGVSKLEANTEITIRVNSRYPVENFRGTKSIVLFSGQGLRNNNVCLSLWCFLFAGFCFVFAIVIRVHLMFGSVGSVGSGAVVPHIEEEEEAGGM